jgi:hypothetical protein
MLEKMIKNSVVRSVGLVAGIAVGIAGLSSKASAQEIPDCTPYPGAAYANGANGTFWGSDFILSNPHTESVSGVIIYTPRDVSRGTGQDIEFVYNLIPREAMVISDIVDTLLAGENGVGMLCVKPDAGNLEPVGRLKVFNYDPDNIAAGQFGQSIEQEEWTYPNGEDFFTIGDSQERTNIVAVTGPEGAVISVGAYSPEGVNQGIVTHYLEPNRYYQWSGNSQQTGAERFAGMALSAKSSLVVGNVGGTAILWGSVVNNYTGDGYSPRFSNRVRGDVPEPTNQPPYLTCLKHLATGGETCDADNNGSLDAQINISAGGPFPGGPEEFEWLAEDPEGDAIHVVPAEALPDYVTLDGLFLTMDPEPEHIGDNYTILFSACDDYGCGPGKSVRFNVVE